MFSENYALKRTFNYSPQMRVGLLLFACLLLIGCSKSAADLQRETDTIALQLVDEDLARQTSKLNLVTPGYFLKSRGEPLPGILGGNSISIGLFLENAEKTDEVATIHLPLAYEYTFTLSEGDSKTNVSLIYRPSDADLTSTVKVAYDTYRKALALAKQELQKTDLYAKWQQSGVHYGIEMILQEKDESHPDAQWFVVFYNVKNNDERESFTVNTQSEKVYKNNTRATEKHDVKSTFLIQQYLSERRCGDLLQQFAKKPEQLEFISCTLGKGQVVFSARYRVSGSQAAAIEQFLHTEYGMHALQFVCCIWEPKDGERGTFLASGRYFSIAMYSDETAEVTDRDQWSDVPFFYIDVDMLAI